MVVAVTAFLVFIHHIIVFHVFSLFFYVFSSFLMVLDGFRWFWKGLEGFGRVGRGGKGWEEVGRGSCYWGGKSFLCIFLRFAIDRSKKYIKTVEIYIKIDAVDPWAAADNRPPPPGHNG